MHLEISYNKIISTDNTASTQQQVLLLLESMVMLRLIFI
jgi:hypothetical protein